MSQISNPFDPATNGTTTLNETTRSPIDGTEEIRLATTGANWKATISSIWSWIQTQIGTWTAQQTFAIGTIAVSTPTLFTQTWNGNAVQFKALEVDITDTLSNPNSLFLDLKKGGTSAAKIGADGTVFTTFLQGIAAGVNKTYIDISTDGSLTFSDNVSAHPFTFSLPASNVLQLGPADVAAPAVKTVGVQNVIAGTLDTGGNDLRIRGSTGTGTGTGGSLVFQVAPAGSTGTAQNSWVNLLELDSTKQLTLTNAFLYGPASRITVGFNQGGGHSLGRSLEGNELYIDGITPYQLTINGAGADYGMIGTPAADQWHLAAGGGTTVEHYSAIWTRFGNFIVGDTGALTTSATNAFLYIPTSAGAPTGTPTAYTGKVALEYDTTNNNLEIYNTAWNVVGPMVNTAPTGSVNIPANYSLVVIAGITIAAGQVLTLGAGAAMRAI